MIPHASLLTLRRLKMKSSMQRFGDWNAVGRALTEETDRNGAPYYQKANEAKQRMNTQELKKQNLEKGMMSHGITTTDYMDEFIDLVWNEARRECLEEMREWVKNRQVLGHTSNFDSIGQVLSDILAHIDRGTAEIEAEPFYSKDNNGVIHLTK